MTTSASAVSRHLRSVGFVPVPTHTYDREGLRVTASVWPGRVKVTADLNSETAAADMAIAARSALKAAGFQVQTTAYPESFYVTGHEG